MATGDRPEKWDIVLLINPANIAFDGCLMVCEEIKSWGVQGFVQALGSTRDAKGGRAYYRANWDEMALTGGSVAPYINKDAI